MGGKGRGLGQDGSNRQILTPHMLDMGEDQGLLKGAGVDNHLLS